MFERHPSHDGSDEYSEPEEYRYIVPTGVHVIFRDHDGNAIARYVVRSNPSTDELTARAESVIQVQHLEAGIGI